MAQVITNLDEVAKQIAADLRVVQKEAIEAAQKTATFRASRSALSKWVSAAAKSARIPIKEMRAHASQNFKRGNSRVIQIGTLPIRGTRLKPKESGRGGGVRFYGARHLPQAFIPKKKRKPVFQREGKSRLPIEVPTFEIKQDVLSTVKVAIDRLNEQFPKEMERKLGVEIRKLARKRQSQTRSAVRAIRRFG